ncbi:long-chain-alcohol oxidase FAO2-like [Phragmites australis]|uniref:long-chain-alcohol oxidase FAO2-like n=1 Tax=Phragmites australis TaxID=29695 RepID=UPI002D78EA17|nr:long-chain-alcohol oxidase FAO2-like [Phragmites australis]
MGEAKKQGHPLLRGGDGARREGYTHGFSVSQMAALTALCGALVPSLPPETGSNGHLQRQEDAGGRGSRGVPPDAGKKAAAVEEFLLASAADPPVPDEVAELMSRMCLPEALVLVRTLLWLLGTRLGTLALCGARCLSWRFPFLRRFDELPLDARECALRRWSRQTLLPPLRMFFLITKVFCLYVFYSCTDENSENPQWRAIGYSPPAAPAVEEGPPKKRPLDNGVVEMINETDASLPASLSEKGLALTEDAARNVCRIECDVVVVGSGCGGSVAAAVLAGAGHKVVVIERGGYFTSRDYTAVEGPSMSQLYEGGGFVSSLSGSALLLAGSTVGGGSAVNWSACIKTPEDVRGEWAREHGLPLFVSPEYVAAMGKVFERLGVTDGCTEEGLQNKVLRKGCEKLGYKVESVSRNSSEGHYCGSCRYGCRTGDKRGTDTTWLVDAVSRGAVILTACKAEKLLLERSSSAAGRAKRCVGVVAKSSNPAITRTLEVRARATVSACGSLLTPVLLSGSGLSNHHIGKNLHLHPTALVWGYFPDTMPDLKGKMYEGGIITSLHKVEGPPGAPARAILETPAMGVAAAGTQFPWVSGRDMKERMLRYGRMVHLFSMVRDRGSGTVHGERRIAYHLDATDRENMREGLRRALRVLAAAGATEIGTHRSDGQRFTCKGATEAALEEFLDSVDVVRGPQSKAEAWSLCCTAHQMGSCRMGATAGDGAVDARGESWEAERLYVCDGSVLPGAVGVNPMVTIQSVAYCLAAGIAESLRRDLAS